ncbi:hypothetical protein [Nitrosomonas supralitoralis]|uniref:Uncharacterized protein n=1 Tax=Nitrosomonas supralitoralis TaxID=2116706 RepID=A0A2P7NYK2_9PROT|nr:hypothetical protein [Nitrosomonas supralitoralis]PSJ18519.1 hypothetical protein C7H79_02750 [Nitrosomonas supralitoralis]
MASVNQSTASDTNHSAVIPQDEYPKIIWKLRSIESTFSFLHDSLLSLQQADEYELMSSADSLGFMDVLSQSFGDLYLIIDQLEIANDGKIQEIAENLKVHADHAGFISCHFQPRVEVSGEHVCELDHRPLFEHDLKSVLLLFNEICCNGLPVWITSLEEIFARKIAGNCHIVSQASNYESVLTARIKAIQPKFQALYDKYIFPNGSQLLIDPEKLKIETEALRKEIWELQNHMPIDSEEGMNCRMAIDQLDLLIRLIDSNFEFRKSDLTALSMIVSQAGNDFSRALEGLTPADGGDLVDTVH